MNARGRLVDRVRPALFLAAAVAVAVVAFAFTLLVGWMFPAAALTPSPSSGSTQPIVVVNANGAPAPALTWAFPSASSGPNQPAPPNPGDDSWKRVPTPMSLTDHQVCIQVMTQGWTIEPVGQSVPARNRQCQGPWTPSTNAPEPIVFTLNKAGS